MSPDRCEFARCQSRETVVTWLGRRLCRKCWERVCTLRDTLPADEVRRQYTKAKR